MSALHLRRLAGGTRCACPHSIWDISLVEFERQVLSHCNHTLLIQLGVPVSGYRAETRSRLCLVQIHSFTILLFSLIVLLKGRVTILVRDFQIVYVRELHLKERILSIQVPFSQSVNIHVRNFGGPTLHGSENNFLRCIVDAFSAQSETGGPVAASQQKYQQLCPCTDSAES